MLLACWCLEMSVYEVELTLNIHCAPHSAEHPLAVQLHKHRFDLLGSLESRTMSVPKSLQLRTLIMINAKTTQKFLALTECQCSACFAFLWRAVPLTFRALVAVGLTEFSFSPISPKVPLWSNPSYSVQSQMTMTIGIDSLSRCLSSSLFTRPNVLKLKLTLSMQKGKGLLGFSQKKCLWWALNGKVLSAW